MKNNMFDTYILLGSNLGNSKKYISDAIIEIVKEIGYVKAKSSLYQTAAWGKIDQPNFLNQVVHVETKLNPEALLNSILSIEKKLGRERIEKWGSRIIDIDILFYDNQVIDKADLVIPHPYLHLRRFTLMPLNEIAPNLIHPELSKSVSQLLHDLDDNLSVEKVEF
ncbi:2-amino-4-hydroxy-6-hydroxymethyldihydropteridine diphosphokinase [Daejeonella sp.]|uniref:2-amino-4-hydroxy-6- hydroxymethyldihydropteridine diphosphokinase n=1 Tax=Daejeonella sp. TaxID=2805397 RepID=UPI0037C14059